MYYFGADRSDQIPCILPGPALLTRLGPGADRETRLRHSPQLAFVVSGVVAVRVRALHCSNLTGQKRAGYTGEATGRSVLCAQPRWTQDS